MKWCFSRNLNLSIIFVFLCLTGCVSSPPQNLDNMCKIFEEKGGWYEDAKASQEKWGTSIPVMMAITTAMQSNQVGVEPYSK